MSGLELGRNPGVFWNPAAWSISSEWFAYLVCPVLIVAASCIRSFLVATGLAVASITVMLLILRHGGFYPFGFEEERGLVRLGGEFITGAMLYRIYLSQCYSRIPWRWMGWVSAVIAICAIDGTTPWLPPFCLAITLLSLAQQDGPLSRMLSTRAMLWLGAVSYALYMSHVFVMELMGVRFQGGTMHQQRYSPLEVLGQVAMLVMISLFVAALLFYFIEQPARSWLRQRIDRRFPAGL